MNWVQRWRMRRAERRVNDPYAGWNGYLIPRPGSTLDATWRREAVDRLAAVRAIDERRYGHKGA